MNPLSLLSTAAGIKGSGDSPTARGLHGFGAIFVAAFASWTLRWLAVHLAGFNVALADNWLAMYLDDNITCHGIATATLTCVYLFITKHWRNIDLPATTISTVALPPAEAVGKAPVTSNTAASGAGDGVTITLADKTVEKLLDPLPVKGINEPTSNT